MNRHTVYTVGLFVAAGVLTCLGCGPSRPATAPVSGKVTYQGKPVAEGRITFLPEHGRPAMGTLGVDGSYRLTTFKADDGAAPGKYKVTIDATHVSGGAEPKSFQDEQRLMNSGNVPKVTRLVPEKFSRPETSTLTAEVKPGPNTINFDL